MGTFPIAPPSTPWRPVSVAGSTQGEATQHPQPASPPPNPQGSSADAQTDAPSLVPELSAEEQELARVVFERLKTGDSMARVLESDDAPTVPMAVRVPLLIANRRRHALLIAYELCRFRRIARHRTPKELVEWAQMFLDGVSSLGIREDVCLVVAMREALELAAGLEHGDVPKTFAYLRKVAYTKAMADRQNDWERAKEVASVVRQGVWGFKIKNRPSAYWLHWSRREQDEYDALRLKTQFGLGMEDISPEVANARLSTFEELARTQTKRII